MIRHTVLIQIKEDVDKGSVISRARSLLYDLNNRLDYLIDISVESSLEELYSTHDMIINSDFESASDLQKFQQDPRHEESSLYIKSQTKDRACVDYRV